MALDSKCNFCGRNSQKAGLLIQGSKTSKKAHICQTCVLTCHEIFNIKNITAQFNSDEKIQCVFPRDIKKYLDEFVVGQEKAKESISIAISNHIKRINNINSKQYKDVKMKKQNLVLAGPTGSGKTYIVEKIAEFLQVPFVIGDATALTEAGYIGDDVESLLAPLLHQANYDVSLAEKGIIYIDEIDKIAKVDEDMYQGRDVGGVGVQQSLLKIIEGTICNVAPMGSKKNGNQQTTQINTKNILFIVGGSFVGLEKIVERRRYGNQLGFNSQFKNQIGAAITPADLIEFGLIPEFVGRFSYIEKLHELTANEMFQIITTSKNCILKQYEKLFSIDNVKLKFTDEALIVMAEEAAKLKIGARGLEQIFNQVLFYYNMNIHKFVKKTITIDRAKVNATLLGPQDDGK